MNTDMQRTLAKTVFSGRVPTRTFHHPGTPLYRHEKPGALIETQIAVRPHMLIAAAVSATWRKEFRRYLKRQMRNVAAMTWRRAIKRGLGLCLLETYFHPPYAHHTPQAWIPNYTVVEWHLRLGPTLRASLEFTRQRIGAHHSLAVQYALREDYAVLGERCSEVRTMRVPDACWFQILDKESAAELKRWNELMAETLRIWLLEQKAVMRLQ